MSVICRPRQSGHVSTPKHNPMSGHLRFDTTTAASWCGEERWAPTLLQPGPHHLSRTTDLFESLLQAHSLAFMVVCGFPATLWLVTRRADTSRVQQSSKPPHSHQLQRGRGGLPEKATGRSGANRPCQLTPFALILGLYGIGAASREDLVAVAPANGGTSPL